MKTLLVSMEPCREVKEAEPAVYIGYRLLGCDRIEHILLSGGSIIRIRKRNEECMFAQLIRGGYTLTSPIITHDGFVRFVLIDSVNVRKILRKYEQRVLGTNEYDIRSLALTPRQRRALVLFALQYNNVSSVAKALNVSKPAAWKLIKKGIRKVVNLYA